MSWLDDRPLVEVLRAASYGFTVCDEHVIHHSSDDDVGLFWITCGEDRLSTYEVDSSGDLRREIDAWADRTLANHLLAVYRRLMGSAATSLQALADVAAAHAAKGD